MSQFKTQPINNKETEQMEKYIELGLINTLKINRETENGFYLIASDEEEVLLPNQYITDDMNIGDDIAVFVYTDSEDRLVATTETPKAHKDQFAFLEVVDTAPFGAFVDMGLQKDLLVPKNRQKSPFKVGQKRIIRVIEDKQSGRLLGVEKITSYLSNDTAHLKRNTPVEVLVMATTPLGFKVIVDNLYEGLIYKNEVFESLQTGDKKDAFIKTVREDGKLDISLQKIGVKNDDETLCKVIDTLKQNDGFVALNSKSDPDDIQKMFAMSKKNFKRSLTTLKEKGEITTDEKGIYLK
jgi:predicted RNA-binding protein (virulence factor B family)